VFVVTVLRRGLFGRSGEGLHPLFDIGQLRMQAANERHSLLVRGDRFSEAESTPFETSDEIRQTGETLFK